jgi:hypothetical protein
MTMFYFTQGLVVRGEVSERLFKLREELLSFPMDVKKLTLLTFCVMKNKCLLSYVTDIFGKLNKLNASVQGENEQIL